MGTNVVSGSGTVVVLSTGVKTYFGILAKRVMSKQAPTSFEVGLNKVTFLFLRFIGIMVPLVFILNGFSKGSWTDAFFFAVSVAVGLTPEMLPMVVTSNLAKGAYSMAQKQVIAKQLNAIQNFGAMDVLCTDKTGTLTLDKVVLEQFCDVQGKQDETVLRYAYINSFFQTGLKGLLDRTILDREKLAIKDIAKVDEIPFDFERKIMSVAVSMNSKHRLIAKGAPEEIFKRCTCYKLHGRVYPIEKRHTQFLRDEYDKLSAQGFRVLAVAYKETSMEKKVFSKEDEHGLILRGYLAFLDPPKPMAKETLHALHGLGIEVKVLTGDNALVTRKICGDVGLDVKGMMTGDELAAVPDDKLRDVVREVTVFARLSPLQKEQIVRALHGNGHVVGFLGDGINDAPALKAADVGISVNNAVDIAKESADLILLHKNLFVLKEGVIEGRKTFGNTMKYIKATASSNFGNVFSVLGASAILPFLPMLPIHLLIQNLLYDFSQTSIPFDEMDPEYLQKPRKWNSKDIGRYMVFIGPISSIFDYTTFALLWFVFGANTIAHAALFQTGWFVEGLLTQTLIIHMLRTEKIPFFQSRASFPVLTLTAIIMAVGIALPYTGVGAAIGLVPLPLGYYPWLLVTLLCYCALTQLVKVWYIRRFKEWI
jgi:Mg2+-importing ATPase